MNHIDEEEKSIENIHRKHVTCDEMRMLDPFVKKAQWWLQCGNVWKSVKKSIQVSCACIFLKIPISKVFQRRENEN